MTSRGRWPCSHLPRSPRSAAPGWSEGVPEHRGWVWVGAGAVGLGLYAFVATLQPDARFGRILAAYGGVFVAAPLAWGMVVDGFRPDRWDLLGALICLVGVAVIMYVPRERGAGAANRCGHGPARLRTSVPSGRQCASGRCRDLA